MHLCAGIRLKWSHRRRRRHMAYTHLQVCVCVCAGVCSRVPTCSYDFSWTLRNRHRPGRRIIYRVESLICSRSIDIVVILYYYCYYHPRRTGLPPYNIYTHRHYRVLLGNNEKIKNKKGNERCVLCRKPAVTRVRTVIRGTAIFRCIMEHNIL